MAFSDVIAQAQIQTARLAAQLGAIDLPESVVGDLLGLNFYVGQQVQDLVTGQYLEVVDAGIQTVNLDTQGS